MLNISKPVTFMSPAGVSVLNCLEVIIFKESIAGWGLWDDSCASEGCGTGRVFFCWGGVSGFKMIYADVKYQQLNIGLKVLLGAGIYLSTVSILDQAVNWLMAAQVLMCISMGSNLWQAGWEDREWGGGTLWGTASSSSLLLFTDKRTASL